MIIKRNVFDFVLCLEYLWSIRKDIRSNENFEFDYPDYGGCPKKISHKLYGDHVDVIQGHLHEYIFETSKKKFINSMLDAYFPDAFEY